MALKQELTIEYFDKKFAELDTKFVTKDDLKDFATKDDLKNFATKDDLKDFATKDDLKLALAEQTKELKQYADEQTDQLAQIIATTVAEPLERHLRDVSMFEEVSMAVWKQVSRKQKRA